jgi:hypothetical protein
MTVPYSRQTLLSWRGSLSTTATLDYEIASEASTGLLQNHIFFLFFSYLRNKLLQNMATDSVFGPR